MEKPSRLHLFQGYGIELEYMIVDRDTLNIKPIADELLKEMAGKYVDEYVNGSVTWSNELVLHVIELKCSEPTKDLWQLNKDLQVNILLINEILKRFNARLMPTAAHPWMNPKEDTFLWPHGNSEVYETYNRIFNCQGHGWANLQSTHINLPFYDDQEFAVLHAAARLILPIIPALAASSPIMDGRYTGVEDKRLVYYQKNQEKIPSITGKIIPENVNSKRKYHKLIYDKIAKDIEPFNSNNILDPVWVNSRGIIARFDRGSLEIRILDIQECPQADLAIATLIIHIIKMLVKEQLSFYSSQQKMEVDPLYKILQGCIESGQTFILTDKDYLSTLGMHQNEASASEVWKFLLAKAAHAYPHEIVPWLSTLHAIIDKGTLAKRILSAVNDLYSHNNLKLIYLELSDNLTENQLFEKCDQSILS